MVSKLDKEAGLKDQKLKKNEFTVLLGDDKDINIADIETLVSELRTHQIELELQNQELASTQVNLSLSLSKYSDLFNLAPCGYMTINSHGQIQEVNNTCTDMFLLPSGSMVSKPLTDFILNEDQDIFYRFQRDLIKNNTPQVCELRVNIQDNKVLHLQFTAAIDTRSNNVNERFRLTLIDITENVAARAQIYLLTHAMQQTPLSILIINKDYVIEYANQTYSKFVGLELSKLVNKNLKEIQNYDESLATCLIHITCLKETDNWQGEYCSNQGTKTEQWESIIISPVINEFKQISHFLLIKRDISLNKLQEQKLSFQANYDNLTELPNRSYALERLSQLITESKRNKNLIAVLFLDLDDFKRINDTLGHDFGDKLLIDVATQLRESLRASDFIARFGGDEFTVFINNLNHLDELLPILNNLIRQLNKGYIIEGRELLITMSIGIAIYPFDNATPSTLLRDADTAMYYAKAHGKNSYSFFETSMNRHVARRLLIEEHMVGSLERKEFDVFFQSQIDIETGELIGVEALLRWHNSIIGDISPIEFIAIAEQTGFIIPLGQFVIQKALTFTAHYQQQYQSDFQIAINLSPRQFRDPHLVEFILNELSKSKLSPNSLELEITEGLLMTDNEHTMDVLDNLKRNGIKISIDDFGTGYSSLSYIRKFPFDVLKVDNSFVREMEKSKSDQSLVLASIAMAHALDLKVVAEGVENVQHLNLLKEMGCDYAQGYLFNKPMSENDFIQWSLDYKKTTH